MMRWDKIAVEINGDELYIKASQMVAFLIGLKLGTLIGSK